MLAYWTMFGIFAAGSMGGVRRTTGANRFTPLLIAALIALVLFIGLRDQVGGDWIPYVEMFQSTARLGWSSVAALGDPGYMLLNRFAAAIGADVWLVNLICAAIFVWGLARLAIDQPNPWLALAIAVPYFVIVVAMGYTRQAVAIGFFMAAISSFLRHRYLRVIVYFLAATLFHKTVIVMLPLLAFATIRHRFVVYWVAAAGGAVIFVFFVEVFLDQLFTNYIQTTMQSEGAGTRVAMNTLAALIYLPFSRYFVRSDEERALWRNFAYMALGLLAALLLTSASTVVDRVSLYLFPLQIFVLSRLGFATSRDSRPNRLMVLGVLLYSGAILGVWLTFASHSSDWLPYRNFVLP